ncbi:hypothetical protein [Paenibacillus sabinae]|uniref:DUF4037 domain-containing protein n=1 Tax=Paenibacillus sabinae T27 TaxID=1268072 RepID=X4ZSP4_9BACL|nr:hypothetical protein [Paenibacillus sabinae]AHV95433.1 hypothetical protein PSAB_02485 [Paenibacillus sabinae T27]
MTRPYVNVSSENKIKEYMNVFESFSRRLESLEGVIGITLNGGLSRGYGDELSEIDLVIYLDSKNFDRWNAGQCPIPVGIAKIEGYLYDIKLVNMDVEKRKKWEPVALWDLSYARILYDPYGEVHALIKDKLEEKPSPLGAEGSLFSCWWYFRLAGDIWIHRGDVAQGHYLLNIAVTKLLETLFVANGEYIPHEKWIVHFSRTLSWTPEQWETRLFEAMSTGDFSLESLVTRQSAIEKLWEEVDRYIVHKECPDLKVKLMQKYFYEMIACLLREEKLCLEEWEQKAGLSLLSTQPFCNFVTIEDGQILVDWNKALSIRPEEVYDWHYSVLEQVLADMQE